MIQDFPNCPECGEKPIRIAYIPGHQLANYYHSRNNQSDIIHEGPNPMVDKDVPYPTLAEVLHSDAVNHPTHYGGEDNPYEAIKVIEAWDLGFCLGNTVKYISRAGKKDKDKELEDLRKAAWYLNREIKKLTSQLSTPMKEDGDSNSLTALQEDTSFR